MKTIVNTARMPVYVILAFFVLHFYGIGHPPLDHHGHRQSDTLEIARIFVEEESSIFLPKVGRRMEYSGITGLEFPAFNYLIAMAFEAREWFLTGGEGIEFDKGVKKTFPVKRIMSPGNYVVLARLLCLLFSIIGMIFFYLLMRRVQGKEYAIYSLIAFASSMTWFYFSRSVQPDVPSLSIGISGLYLFARFIEDRNFFTGRMFLLLSSLCFLVAGLMKPPSLILLFPALFLAVKKDRFRVFLRPEYPFFAVIILTPLFLWLMHAAYLSETHGLPYFFLGRPFSEGVLQVFSLKFGLIFLKRIFQEYTSWALAPFLIYGCYLLRKRGELLFFAAWFLGFIIYAFRAGNHIIVHDYYGLPIVPLLAAISGIGLKVAMEKQRKIRFALLAIVAIIPVHLYQVYRFDAKYLVGKEERLHGIVPYSARVAVNGGNWPVHLYMIHRKGGSFLSAFTDDPSFVAKLKKKGYEYIVLTNKFDRKKTEMLYGDRVIVSDEDLMVIRL